MRPYSSILRAFLGLVALGVPALSAAPAAAQAQDGFRELVDKGLELYTQKKYDDAIKSFEQAYALRAEPELVYNIARAHEKSLRRAEAIAAYEKFVNLPGTTAELRTKALNAMEALRAEQAALDRAKVPAKVDVSAPTPADREGTSGVAAQVEPERSAPVLPWALVGVGAAGMGVGAVFGLLALDAKSDFDKARAAEKADKATTVETRALVADIALFGGAAVAVTGVILLLVEGGDATPSETAWVPTLGPGGVGLAGRF
jgi:tetratricopeptide (TPR) repeat protein